MTLQPEKHVGFAAHRADFDDLLEAEKMRGHAAVNDIGQLGVAFVKGFDDRGGVNAGGGAKCVAADDRIVWRES